MNSNTQNQNTEPFDLILRKSQDEFVESFQGEWPERYPDEDAIRVVPDFDVNREFAFAYVNKWSSQRVLVIVS